MDAGLGCRAARMTAASDGAPAVGTTPGRIEFETSDAQSVSQYLGHAYGHTVRMSGGLDGNLFRHSRVDAGSFSLDDMCLPLDLSFHAEPLNALAIISIVAGRMERKCGRVSERFGSGDAFVAAQPELPFWIAPHDASIRVTRVTMPVVAQVAEIEDRSPGPVQFSSYRPASATLAAHWQDALSFAARTLANPEAASQPLITGGIGRLLAAAALAVFPSTARSAAVEDRRDANAATARRAITFIDEHAGDDITVGDIAAAAHVGIRAVQLAFRSHLGMTPMGYLRSVRLDCAHRQLRAADPAATTVTAIAARWGFARPSRFTAYYRATFGVLPSQTLRT